MEIALIVITGLALAVAVFALIKLSAKKPEAPETSSLLLIQDHMEKLRSSVEKKLDEARQSANQAADRTTQSTLAQIGESRKLIESVTEKLTKLD